ncbi:Acyl-CoA synthetase (AMP-forming)/AMP-acid ligase II [Corynebacterium camporealensis]|uniref:Acyl-CoA synthetase (AMP-forming)/AMP-acid ligase II n=1 Tax=Corynebacterium camporealensis TaxID=161896 RepID=A0A0F6QV02_9CORY|nr:AMP-binding protein [Corynebacterium camporealensis]AKE38537.1 acyl-CoA synthetase (AMP-forming)/AMP-acid ligase II [Corynebacterium camporealensis]AVH87834.1 Acyl-CoA synthetase (AMP-forming)/AMP-acid ligase II [Corynebacterium camporealensis]
MNKIVEKNCSTFEYREEPLVRYLEDIAEQDPQKEAILFYGSSFSYKWLNETAELLALRLAMEGVRKGDVIAAYMQNCPQFVATYFAAQKLGAVISPCNPMLKSKELKYQLEDLEAVALIASSELVHEFEALDSTSVRTLIVTSFDDVLDLETHSSEYRFAPPARYEPKAAHLTWQEAVSHNSEAESYREHLCPDVHFSEDVSLIIYTSGTSGLPKGAMLSYRNCTFKANCVAANFEYTSGDRVSATMPIFHVAGMVVGMTAVISVGATMVLQARFDAEDFVDLAVRHGMTFSYTTPPINAAILSTGRGKELSILRQSIGTSFGSQITESLSDEWEAATGQKFYEFAYGMSETHTADTMTPPGGIVWGSTGLPTFCTDIQISDPEDRSRILGPNELGEISIKSPAVFLGYKGKPDATDAAMVDGRYYTGDMGRIDENGYLFFDGRFKEMIKSNGYSVFPEEVEKYLQDHPAVKQAVAIGVPDRVRGESVKAFIVLREDASSSVTEDDIVQWARDNMAAYKYPRLVEFIDKVPETATGKMLRAKLREA